MATDDELKVSAPKFDIRRVPYARISRQISDGMVARIDPSDLAAEIREHGLEKIPPSVVEFLCDHLDGSVVRSGRPGKTDAEKQHEARLARLIYVGLSMVEAGDADASPEALDLYRELREIVAEGANSSETRWRMVAQVVLGNPGHSKKLANLVSEWAPLKD